MANNFQHYRQGLSAGAAQNSTTTQMDDWVSYMEENAQRVALIDFIFSLAGSDPVWRKDFTDFSHEHKNDMEKIRACLGKGALVDQQSFLRKIALPAAANFEKIEAALAWQEAVCD